VCLLRRLIKAAEGISVTTVLSVDEGDIVGSDDSHAWRGVGARQKVTVRGGRGGEPADVLVQHGALERQLDDPTSTDECARGVKIPLGRAERTKLLVDRRPTHEHIGQDVVELVPASYPSCLVEQPLRFHVGQPGPFCPGERAKGERQRLWRARAPRPTDQLRGFGSVALGIGNDPFVYAPSLYHKLDWCLFINQASFSALIGTRRSVRSCNRQEEAVD
jgi:hypothetical protein